MTTSRAQLLETEFLQRAIRFFRVVPAAYTCTCFRSCESGILLISAGYVVKEAS